jgi:hypothetical protein
MSEASEEVFPLAPGHPRCGAPAPRGPCKVAVSMAGQSCWQHDPAIPEAVKHAARSRGGQAAARLKAQARADAAAVPAVQSPPPTLPVVDTGPLAARIAAATTPDDLTVILTEVAGMVAGGTMPPKTGSVIGALIKIALETQRATFHRRLDQIEAALNQNHPELAARTPRRRR